MSVVGNFTQNYDRQEQTTGAGIQRMPSRSQSQAHGAEYGESERAPPTTAEREAEVHELARVMSGRSAHTTDKLFEYEHGGPLDPFSEKFDAKRWVMALTHLSQDEGTNPARTSGISYRNMSVHGFGSDAGESRICIESEICSD
jgi:ATP-binding cassette subfamily G (WHITE) protein 2 (PDR)